jgi:hypothetical protein
VTATLAQAALWYAHQGIAVFPLKPRAKVPLLPRAHPAGETCRGGCGKHGHGLWDATVDPVVVDGWWTATPDANIGLPTGGRFDVIDIDGDDGLANIVKLCSEVVLDAPLGIVATPRGEHWYMPPTGYGNGVGGNANWLKGVDYRGIGGYVVAPPSINADGVVYKWLLPPTLPPATQQAAA